MYCFRIIPILLSLSTFVGAQSVKSDFPEITTADLLQTHYEIDTTASAVMLYNKGETVYDLYYGMTTTNYVRIKIFKKSAFGYGNVRFLTSSGFNAQVKAVTHTFDKKLNKIVHTEMSNESIFKTRQNKYADKIAFTLPNLTEGAIIEYSFVSTSNPFFLTNWTFQHRIPVAYSEFLLHPPDIFHGETTGTLPAPMYYPKHKVSYQRWVMRDIPALKPEPLMPSEKSYRSTLRLKNKKLTWDDIIRGLYGDENFWGIVRDNVVAKRVAREITQGLSSDDEKIKAICQYVKNEILWDGNYDFYADEAAVVLQRKKGTSGDVNLLLGTLLYNSGYAVGMVLVSTKDNGFVNREFASRGNFNHVLCLVQAKDTLLLDATDKFLPHDVLPTSSLNYDGLMFTTAQSGWVTIAPVAKDKVIAQVNVELSHTGELTGTLNLTHEGYAARDVREMIFKDGKEEYIKDFSTEHNLSAVASEVQSSDYYKPVTQRHEISMTDKATVNGDHIYLNPFLFLALEENPFTASTRHYPVDFGVRKEQVFIGDIKIPAGYVVEEMPPGKIFTMPGNAARYTFDCQFRNDRIIITTKFQRNKIMIEAQEYPDLREFYARIVAKNLETIVLKKVAP